MLRRLMSFAAIRRDVMIAGMYDDAATAGMARKKRYHHQLNLVPTRGFAYLVLFIALVVFFSELPDEVLLL